MGTRADFYIGRGESAEWLGSIAWDGYPEGIKKSLFRCATEAGFRRSVAAFLKSRDDKSLPSDGWPWPWETSSTTDFAYAFDEGAVHGSCFGSAWFDPKEEIPEGGRKRKAAVFPNMSKGKRRPVFGAHSGIMLISATK